MSMTLRFVACFNSTPEAVGALHYSVLRSILELVLKPSGNWGFGWWSELYGRFVEEVSVSYDLIFKSASRLNSEMVFLNGVEALEHDYSREFVREAINRGFEVGVATTCGDKVYREALEASYVILNVTSELLKLQNYKSRVKDLLYSRDWVEVHVYVKGGFEKTREVLGRIPYKKNVPVHIKMYEARHKEAYKAREFLESMGVVNTYLYINDEPINDVQLTRCYECKEIVAVRRGIRVSKLNINGDKCPKCGCRVFMKKPIENWLLKSKLTLELRVPIPWLYLGEKLRSTMQ